MHTGGPSVIFQLELTDASGATTTVVTDSSWQAFNGDVHRRPGPAIDGGSAGTAFLCVGEAMRGGSRRIPGAQA